MNTITVERFSIENHLRRALDNGELQLYYQPQLDIKKREIVGVEALLRWNHPEMDTTDQAIALLMELKSIGVQISIDDFGTGFSSLNYLNRFPIDILKIDKSFIRDISFNSDDNAIITAIISLVMT